MDHEVTINFVVSVHEHRNTLVVQVDRSGTTDSGFTMIPGTESFVSNGNIEREASQISGDILMVPTLYSGPIVFNLNQQEVLRGPWQSEVPRQ